MITSVLVLPSTAITESASPLKLVTSESASYLEEFAGQSQIFFFFLEINSSHKNYNAPVVTSFHMGTSGAPIYLPHKTALTVS